MDYPERLVRALPSLLEKMGIDDAPGLERLHGDASNRSYFRVSADGRTFIAMVLPEKGPSSIAEEITKTSRPITQLPFIDVQNYLEYKRVLVPSIYGYNEAAGILLLEDLGDRNLFDIASKGDVKQSRALYELALEQLERLALIADTVNTAKCIAFSRAFDADLYNWEFNHFV